MDNDEVKTDVETKENGKNSASDSFYEEFGLFGSPKLQYLEKKEEFLKEFLFPENWGRKGSKKRVVAINTVIKYLEDIKKLVDLYPLHLSGVESENVELFFSHCKTTGVMRLPIPSDVAALEKLGEIAFRDNKSREVQLARLLTAFKAFRDRASDFYEWSEIDRVNNFDDYRAERSPRSRNGFWSWSTEAQYFSKDQTLINDDDKHDVPREQVENDRSKTFEQKMKREQSFLKRLHRSIFSRIKSQKPVSIAFSKYRSRVKSVIRRYKAVLPRMEISALKRKLKETETAVEQSSKGIVLDKIFEQPKPPTIPDLPSHSWFSQAVSEMKKSETDDLKTSIAFGGQLTLPLTTAFAISSMLEGRNVSVDDIHEMGIRLARAMLEKVEKAQHTSPANKGGWGRRVPWWAPPHLPDPVPRVGLGPNICSISNPTSLVVIVVKLLCARMTKLG